MSVPSPKGRAKLHLGFGEPGQAQVEDEWDWRETALGLVVLFLVFFTGRLVVDDVDSPWMRLGVVAVAVMASTVARKRYGRRRRGPEA